MISEQGGAKQMSGIAPDMSASGPWMRPISSDCLRGQHQPSHVQRDPYAQRFTQNEPEMEIAPMPSEPPENIQRNSLSEQPASFGLSPAGDRLSPSHRSRVVERSYAPLENNDSNHNNVPAERQSLTGLHAEMNDGHTATYDTPPQAPAQIPFAAHNQALTTVQTPFAAYHQTRAAAQVPFAPYNQTQAPLQPQFTPRGPMQAPIQPQFAPRAPAQVPMHPPFTPQNAELTPVQTHTQPQFAQHSAAQGSSVQAPMQASTYPTLASPKRSSSLSSPALLSPKATCATPAGGLRHMPDEDDLEDEQEDAMPTASMATPATVPCSNFTLPAKRKGLVIAILSVSLLIGVIGILWATGLLDRLLAPSATVPANDRIPAIFAADFASGQEGSQPDGLAPALSANTPVLDTFTVESASAIAPATLTFTLRTFGATSSIRLLNAQGIILPAKVTSRPEGDGTLWRFETPFDTAYTGAIHAYLRDSDGSWIHSEITCQISVE